MRATCVLTTVPVATAGRAPVKILILFAAAPLLASSRATAAIPVGPDEEEIENDVDRLDKDRPLPLPLPLPLPRVVSAPGRGIEEADDAAAAAAAASEGANAGGESR